MAITSEAIRGIRELRAQLTQPMYEFVDVVFEAVEQFDNSNTIRRSVLDELAEQCILLDNDIKKIAINVKEFGAQNVKGLSSRAIKRLSIVYKGLNSIIPEVSWSLVKLVTEKHGQIKYSSIVALSKEIARALRSVWSELFYLPMDREAISIKLPVDQAEAVRAVRRRGIIELIQMYAGKDLNQKPMGIQIIELADEKADESDRLVVLIDGRDDEELYAAWPKSIAPMKSKFAAGKKLGAYAEKQIVFSSLTQFKNSLNSEQKKRVTEYLKEHGSATMTDLAYVAGVSLETQTGHEYMAAKERSRIRSKGLEKALEGMESSYEESYVSNTSLAMTDRELVMNDMIWKITA